MPRDASAIANIYVDSWRSTYAGVLPDEVLLKLNSSDREKRWWRQVLGRYRRNHLVQVAEDSRDGVVGFASGGPARGDNLPYRSEIYTLYLRDEFHSKGIGKRLFVGMSERLFKTRGPSMMVWVLRENPSRFFYEALGGKFVARRTSSVGGAPVEEFAYGWEDVGELIALGKSDEAG